MSPNENQTQPNFGDGPLPPPKRSLQLHLDAHADTAADLADALRDFAHQVDAGDWPDGADLVIGGTRSSYTVQLQVDKAKTPEVYREELAVWHAEKKRRTLEARGL